MAPLVGHGGRREYLVQSLVYLARELVIGDGLSRQMPEENARRIEELLYFLEREHEAVRLGGDRDIKVGADLRFSSHNEVMYEPGCPWRAWRDAGAHRRESTEEPKEDEAGGQDAEEGERGECYLEGRNDAAANGLNHLMLSFFDAIRAILFKYAPPGYVRCAPFHLDMRTRQLRAIRRG
eukprot:1451082-Rhodomonas_salina.3